MSFAKVLVLLTVLCCATANILSTLAWKTSRSARGLIEDCLKSPKGQLLCLSEKAAGFLENATYLDIPILEGVTLKVNRTSSNSSQENYNHQLNSNGNHNINKETLQNYNKKTNQQQSIKLNPVVDTKLNPVSNVPDSPQIISSSKPGFSRLTTALSNFWNSHTISVDISQIFADASNDEDEEDDEENTNEELDNEKMGDKKVGDEKMAGDQIPKVSNRSGRKLKKKYDKQLLTRLRFGLKQKRYLKYALLVLMGIFGLTGPLVMKTLTILAAKALLASKIALLIVGGVTLKKIFAQEDNKGSVKVHAIPYDDGWYDKTDRVMQNVDEGAYQFLNTYNNRSWKK